MSRKLARIAVNRAKLHADLPALRVTCNGRTRHARTVKVFGPCIVAQVKVRGKSLAYVVTESELELLK
jgi:hypothetical protein